MKIWAHTIVKNEERYVWYALMSVINYVDKILVYDTGSTDNTLLIIKEIKKKYPDKIIVREVGDTDINKFTQVRQQMFNETKADWVWIHDADEVWWNGTARAHVEAMNDNVESIVVRYLNMVGDIYHVQPEAAGKYKIDNKEGHLTIRAMSMKIPGLHVTKPHGVQGFFDEKGTLVQERDSKRRKHIDGISYLHFTHMIRSKNMLEDKKVPKRSIKYKKELGIALPGDFYYPEVFFIKRPEGVPSPWVKRTPKENLEALAYTLPRAVKRKIWRGGSGY